MRFPNYQFHYHLRKRRMLSMLPLSLLLNALLCLQIQSINGFVSKGSNFISSSSFHQQHGHHRHPVTRRRFVLPTTKSDYSLFPQYRYHASIQPKTIQKMTKLFMAVSSSDDNNETTTKASRPTQQRRNLSNQKKRSNFSNQKKRRNDDNNNNIKSAIQRNKKIISLGKQGEWKEILRLYKKEKDDFNNVNYSTTMSQFQRMGRKLDRRDRDFLQFVDDLAEKIQSRGLDWIGIQGIANIVHAMGKMRLRSKSAKSIIQFTSDTNTACDIVTRGSAQAVANICWSMATLGDTESFPTFLAQVESHLECFFKHSKPQEVANTAWACGTLGIRSPKLFAEIEQRSSWLVAEGIPQAVANTAWACATLGVRSPKLFAEIEQRSSWLVAEGNPQNVANTAWACGTLGVQSPKLFAEIEQRSSWLVAEGNPQEVANTAWACGTLGVQSPKLFAEIDKRSSWLVEEGKPQNVASIALAYANLGIQSDLYFQCFLQNAEKFLTRSNAQNVINSCYAISVLGIAAEHEEKFKVLWSKALGFDPQSFLIVDWAQLAQSYAFVSASGVQLQEPKIPPTVIFDETAMPMSTIEVSDILNEIGFIHEQEICPFAGNDIGTKKWSHFPPGMLAIDMACRERMIAIEYDGPSHFLIDIPSGKVSHVENGATKAKRRFLERLGWRVINIHYLDWIKANSKEGKQSLLRSLLDLD